MVWALVASLAAAGSLALWPTDDDSGAAGLLPTRAAPRGLGATATAPTAAPTATATASTTATASATPSGTTSATPRASAAPVLPTRAADWPTPNRQALAAWQGPPPPPAAVAKAAAVPAVAARPAVPEFPYRWIGQLDDGGAPQVLLASAQRSVGVRLGAVLDGRWRLARDAGGTLHALYLATGDKATVRGAPAADPP